MRLPPSLAGYQVASSTTLQMLLYFNALYSLVFGILFQFLFDWKLTIWSPPLVIELITPMGFWVWAFVEVRDWSCSSCDLPLTHWRAAVGR